MTKTDGAAADFRHARHELDVTQSEMAYILGLSEKAVQSYEQGWRQPPETIRRLLNVVLVSHRLKRLKHNVACWQQKHCPPALRKSCRAFQLRQGALCWLLKGTKCNAKPSANGKPKSPDCSKCKVPKRLGIVVSQPASHGRPFR